MKGEKFFRILGVLSFIFFLGCSQDSILDSNNPEPWPPFPLQVGNSWDYKYTTEDTIKEDDIGTILRVSIISKFIIDSYDFYQLECYFPSNPSSSTYYYVLQWIEKDSMLYRYKGNKGKLEPIMAFDFSIDDISSEINWGRCKTKLTTNYYYYKGMKNCRFYKVAELPKEINESQCVTILKSGRGFVFDSTFGELQKYSLK